MTDENSPHIQRASQINIVGLCVGVVLIILGALLIQILVFPQTFSLTTQPTGAKVYVNGELRCEATPCDVSLYSGSQYKIIFDRAQHSPHITQLFPFNRKLVKAESMPIKLQSRFEEDERTRAVETCRKDRERELEGLAKEAVNFDAKPCFRSLAVMPWQAERSGHCHVVLNVDTNGYPTNIRLGGCTEDIFMQPTKDAVRAWRYVPAVKNGEPVLRENVETRMKFRLKNASGNTIPEAPKFTDDPDHPHDIGVE